MDLHIHRTRQSMKLSKSFNLERHKKAEGYEWLMFMCRRDTMLTLYCIWIVLSLPVLGLTKQNQNTKIKNSEHQNLVLQFYFR